MRERIYNKLRSIFINPFAGIVGIIKATELQRIRRMKRYEGGESVLFGKRIYFTDNIGYLSVVQEQFVENQNDFISSSDTPLIIDCGANIGLSTLYFKRKYPNAKIIAFEPDKNIFQVLTKNVESFGLTDVELKNEAVWIENTTLKFFSDNSLAGSVEFNATGVDSTQNVAAIRLKSVLEGRKIHFLKIDIEGAENTVIYDIREELKNVETLFIEYHSTSGKEQKLPDLLSIISNAGFRYYIKNGFDYCLHPFIDKKMDSFDFCLNIFCYRGNR